ncbi:M67 family metallopeptidase [Candidatus Methylospira mobilis]|uniref:M67 family metallopeptidase n=1 Tax=Candidatus Methylospira mobilis TaxID=1808979 RepID=A0A5Q0BNK2_9GAMM|nr:M67 family metallopeptidase [Candidatus Methylospira mobilis]QFY45189.1 M67 family metallopeptidase [Candidatus Methylospira mobilis]WNV06204.1 M67 family metallopeptidase [Candidatus Methylospira mobilis]
MTTHVIPGAPVKLPRTLVNQLLHFAQASPGKEVCGLIGVDRQHLYHFYPIPNVAETPGNRFEMEPLTQIATLRDIRERELDLFAIVHSHPGSAAEPSAADLTEIGYPEALYLIISLNTRGVLEMRAYTLDGQSQAFREVPLIMQH